MHQFTAINIITNQFTTIIVSRIQVFSEHGQTLMYKLQNMKVISEECSRIA